MHAQSVNAQLGSYVLSQPTFVAPPYVQDLLHEAPFSSLWWLHVYLGYRQLLGLRV